MFSKYLKYLLKSLQFAFIVIVRFLKILFRWQKRIELLYLNYNNQNLFDKSYIVINYRFRNVLWYRFGKHKTLEKKIKIFDLTNFDKEFDLIVYGFFQKKVYSLKFEPKLKLDNSSFKTSFSNLSLKLLDQSIPKLAHTGIHLKIDKPIIKNPKIVIKQTIIRVKTNTYNQNEFI